MSSSTQTSVGAPILYAFSEIDTLASALSSLIVDVQKGAIDSKGTFNIAISGSAIKTLATALLSNTNGIIAYSRWSISFADECAVPLDNADSNYALLKAELLDKLPVSHQPAVHPIDPDLLDDLEGLSDSYETKLIDKVSSRGESRFPNFDLVLLGCGLDGHTCGLFPNHELLKEESSWVAYLDDSPEAPAQRITLTLPVLNHARAVAFITNGQPKAEILRTVLDQPNAGLPCSLVRPKHPGQVYWFVDDAAAEQVSYPKTSFNF